MSRTPGRPRDRAGLLGRALQDADRLDAEARAQLMHDFIATLGRELEEPPPG